MTTSPKRASQEARNRQPGDLHFILMFGVQLFQHVALLFLHLNGAFSTDKTAFFIAVLA